jgi:hypothetical protein
MAGHNDLLFLLFADLTALVVGSLAQPLVVGQNLIIRALLIPAPPRYHALPS